MTDLTKLGVIGYKKGLEDGEFSAVEGVKAFQEKIEKSDLNAFITTTFDSAFERAKKKSPPNMRKMTFSLKCVISVTYTNSTLLWEIISRR